MVKPDLAVQLGPLKLKNPVLAASGTFGYGLEFLPFLDLSRLGGFVTTGLSPRPREGNPPPRIVETPAGMLNTLGLHVAEDEDRHVDHDESVVNDRRSLDPNVRPQWQHLNSATRSMDRV